MGGRMDWAQERIESTQLAPTIFYLPSQACFPDTRFLGNFADMSLSSPIAAAGAYFGDRGQMSFTLRRPLAASVPLLDAAKSIPAPLHHSIGS